MSELAPAPAGRNGREFDVTGFVAFLLGHRKWILGCVVAFGLAGVLYALLAPSVYTAGATIALKESDMSDGASRLFSQFGAVGGVVTGNAGLTKMAIMLQSHEISEQVVRDNDLLPMLFPKKWDAKRKAWKPMPARKIPTLRDGARELQHGVIADVQLRKSVVNFSVQGPSAAWAKRLADMYLAALRNRMRDNVMASAAADRKYLEAELQTAADPVMREKLQSMIVLQIEKSMLVSAQGFDVLEGPAEPHLRTSPQRRKIVEVALLLGLVFSIATLYGRGWVTDLGVKLRERASGNTKEKTE